jgi:TfoX/Sxy family transcriptional regulator of competence genes
MAYNIELADRVREFLATKPAIKVEEKKMFRGLTFMVNGKMCVSVSNDNLMCRFDPSLQDEVAERKGFQSMRMKGREYKGYCYVSESGYKAKKDFEYWLHLCLDFNDKAKATKRTE